MKQNETNYRPSFLSFSSSPLPRPDAFGHAADLAVTHLACVRLLKHIIRCYLRLSDNPRARDALKHCLPEQLKDLKFTSCLKDDLVTKRWLAQLLVNVGHSMQTNPQNAASQNVAQQQQQQQPNAL